jgi:hypothetical protein
VTKKTSNFIYGYASFLKGEITRRYLENTIYDIFFNCPYSPHLNVIKNWN